MPMHPFNQILGNMQYATPSLLEGYIDNIKNRYGANLNFHDLVGVSGADPQMEKVFGPYLYHNNSFCNFVKKHDRNFSACVKHKGRLCLHCRQVMKPFYGSCYMGVEEFVFPIKCGDSLIAVICAGQFFKNLDKSLARIGKAAVQYGIDEEECTERYLEATRKIDFSIVEFSRDIGILCECISLLYANFIHSGRAPLEREGPGPQAASMLKNHFIVSNTIRFIRENYGKELSLPVIAANSYCNPSYLSHSFKEKTGVNITDYINQVRMEAAKQLLDSTPRSVTEICMLTGFNDPGYFARVFKQVNGCSPREYRERDKENNL